LLRVSDLLHDTTQYGNNPIECDHGRLTARRGHYELGVEARPEHLCVAAAFDELSVSI
jgi:hypothetical protein